MKIATADTLRAADARALGPATLPAELSFSTDTRSLVPGDAFVALRGERFDGHDFLEAARAAGAALAVVDDARLRSRARFVAITGSAGKTTTKAFLAQVLEQAAPGRVVATPRNENNEIGVAKLLLGLPGDARFVVVELGARHGIRTLCSAEVDINLDGSLAYDDEVLAELDIVVASVHSGFSQTAEEVTARVMRATEHRYVHILGHPTGRKVLQRDSYKVDLAQLLPLAARLGVAVEHNAAPARADLKPIFMSSTISASAKFIVLTIDHGKAIPEPMS